MKGMMHDIPRSNDNITVIIMYQCIIYRLVGPSSHFQRKNRVEKICKESQAMRQNVCIFSK